MLKKFVILGFCLTLMTACTQQGQRKDLGNLKIGSTVSFVRDAGGEWGIQISDSTGPILIQQKPAQIEVFSKEQKLHQLEAGYKSLKKETNAEIGKAKLVDEGGTKFYVEDHWMISGDVLSLDRKVSVTGTEDSAGFYSAVRLLTRPTIKWEDANYLAPGLLYGDPTYDGETSPGGTLNYQAKRFSIREDLLSAPLFTLSFHDGNWVAVLDPAPNGETTAEESISPANTPVIDKHIKFGALGAHEVSGGGVEFGFWMPGTTDEFGGGFGRGPITPLVRRRYNPVTEGFSHSYQVAFRFGHNDSFRDVESEVWRWAWESLNPKVSTVDLDVVRRTLIDHLSAHVLVAGNLAGVPFLYDAVTGKPGSYRRKPTRLAAGNQGLQSNRASNRLMESNEMSMESNIKLAKWAAEFGIDLDPNAYELYRWPQILMGFVSKGIESADQLLLEGDRDPGPRGQKMREQGLMIINSFVKTVGMSPPAGEGFNLWTGKPDCQSTVVMNLRSPSEGMRTLIDSYRREKSHGHEHPEWLSWCIQFADWLLKQQNEDGSFARSWNAGKGTVNEASGTSSYNPVTFLVKLSEVTAQKKYINTAIRAADYIWTNYGSKGVFVGGATDNPNIVDKEAGMLSLNAFLSLYESTKDPRWLEYAKTAGNYTESWIWIWNVPMPVGANDSTLNWKRGVSTVGVQGITARASGGVDEYLAWGAPDYVRLYKYTNDEHYLDIARILLHNTKAMLALPGRTFDLFGPGWQQENWSMGRNRGYGSHRSWLPWISVNHLHGITGIEEFDKDLYQKLSKGN
jgi:hypothetical protein